LVSAGGGVLPSATTPPCDSSNGINPAAQADGAVHEIGISPNPEDKPNPRQLQLVGAVDNAGGTGNITGVFWKVFHPDGSFKVQVVGTPVRGGAGTCALPTGLLGLSQTTGEISANAASSITGLCQQGTKIVFLGTFELHKWQECGTYRVQMTATANNAPDKVLSFSFDVLCTQSLQIDFTSVSFDTITPGGMVTVPGDNFFASPPCAANTVTPCPSAKNVGNSGMGIVISFTDSVQCQTITAGACTTPVPGAKVITQFDACFGRTPSTIVCQNEPGTSGCPLDLVAGSPAGCTVELFNFAGPSPARDQVLCANEVGKIDLSIHPQSGLPTGNYIGTVTVVGADESLRLFCGEGGAGTTNGVGNGIIPAGDNVLLP